MTTRHKPDFDDSELNWGFDPAVDEDTYTSDELKPGGSKRSGGWTGPGEKPSHRHFNWLMARITRLLRWAGIGIVPHYDGLHEVCGYDWSANSIGEPILEPGDVFRVKGIEPDTTWASQERWAAGPFNGITPVGASDIDGIDTDSRIVVIAVDTEIQAYDWEKDGAELWSFPHPLVAQATAVCCDTQYVHAGFANGIGSELYQLDPLDGSAGANVDFGSDIRHLAANTTYLAVLEASSTDVTILNADTYGTIRTIIHGATVNSICVVNNAVIQAGQRSTYDVRISDMFSGTLIDGITVALSAGIPEMADVASDGELVAFAGATITDGSDTYNVWVYGGFDSNVLVWRTEVAGTPNQVAIDERYVYIGTTSGVVRVFEKYSGAHVGVLNAGSNDRAISVDGVWLWSGDGDSLVQLRRPDPANLFQLADGAAGGMVNARPWPKFALPLR